MKKSISVLAISMFLMLMGVLSFPPLASRAEITESDASEVIKTATGLADYINGYNDSNANDIILLGADLDMSGVAVNGTIGTEDNPFTGIFDGNGYSIKNLTLNLANTSTEYVEPTEIGLFGATDGATIMDLELEGNLTIQISNSPDNLKVGTLVGRAENTTIENCNIKATQNFQDLENKENLIDENKGIKSINAGGIAGELIDSTVKNTFYRPENESAFVLKSIFKRDARFGGVAGLFENSSAIFVVSSPKFKVTLNESFAGTTYVGGVFGSVSQGNSKVINAIVEPTINVENSGDKVVYAGAIGGYIFSPAPEKNNLSYIYYNSSLLDFGFDSDYVYRNNLTRVDDTIITHKNESNVLSAKDYFTAKAWSGIYGEWDFSNVFEVLGNDISLQAFGEGFSVTVRTSSSSVDGEIITILDDDGSQAQNNQLEISKKYNDTINIKFKFNENVSELIGQYYSLSGLTLSKDTSQEIAYFVKNDDVYKLVASKGYERLKMTEENGIYTITINGITSNYTGTYQLNVTANNFVGLFEYRLFDKEGDEVQKNNTECVVYNKNGSQNFEFQTNDITYNSEFTITTRANPNSIYQFVGWYFDDDGDYSNDSTPLSTDNDLNFTFGKDDFALTDNFKVYAKYVDNSCEITFTLDEGVERIIISTNEEAITTSGTTIKVRKQSNVKIEIYIKDDHLFDVQRFTESVNIYKGECTRVDDGSDPNYYQFNLDTTKLNDESFSNILNLEFKTEKGDTTNWKLIWIIVGSILGALVIATVIIVVVVVVKRRGGGGGKHKSYGNMYY